MKFSYAFILRATNASAELLNSTLKTFWVYLR